MYEHRRLRPIPLGRFVLRFAWHVALAFVLVGLSLLAGMQGYERYENLPWRDAFLNAAMLLGGMGPVDAPRTDAGKLFAGCYALYAGLVFLVIASILLAPVVHRFLHRLHWEEQGDR